MEREHWLRMEFSEMEDCPALAQPVPPEIASAGGMTFHCDITSTLHTSPEESAGLFVGEVEWKGNTGYSGGTG